MVRRVKHSKKTMRMVGGSTKLIGGDDETIDIRIVASLEIGSTVEHYYLWRLYCQSPLRSYCDMVIDYEEVARSELLLMRKFIDCMS